MIPQECAVFLPRSTEPHPSRNCVGCVHSRTWRSQNSGSVRMTMTRDLPYPFFGQDVILNPGCPKVSRFVRCGARHQVAIGRCRRGSWRRGGAGRQAAKKEAASASWAAASAASATLPPPRFPSVENGSNHPRSETGRAPENVEIRRSTSLTSCIASPPDAMSRRLRPGKTVNQRARKTTLCELRNSGFAAS